MEELFSIKNHGRSTYLWFAGIRLGRGIKGIKFAQSGKNVQNPELTLTIDIRLFLQELSEITPEELEQAKETVKVYLKGYKETATEDGSSSVEFLR